MYVLPTWELHMSHLDGTGGGVRFSDCRRGGMPGARGCDNGISMEIAQEINFSYYFQFLYLI